MLSHCHQLCWSMLMVLCKMMEMKMDENLSILVVGIRENTYYFYFWSTWLSLWTMIWIFLKRWSRWWYMKMKVDENLSILVVEIREKTCDRFKGYVSRNLKLVIVICIFISIIIIVIIMIILWPFQRLCAQKPKTCHCQRHCKRHHFYHDHHN